MTTNVSDHATFDQVDLADFDEEGRHKLLMGAVSPRPIALVTTVSEGGVLNAAPFSQYVVISITPPLLGFVAHETPEGYKDTVRNVKASGEFVVNCVTASMAHQVQRCSEPFPADVSEVCEVGFHILPSVHVAPARIAESPIHFECRLYKSFSFGADASKATLIVGEVLLVHGAPGVFAGHRVNHANFKPLGRIAGRAYCLTQEVLHV
ncbi:flavin reductase family protein [Polaromonas sp. P1-6]|nr:flavin reductase family protein [Polaromonas sp. P1-6]